ncbi:ABC transporter substrate-binding protein [Neglectibacter timonensis]|uniref:ABC transporter substrate-binding protein n=3 Tax=Neglectibacter timonensis TaxID=1776382 RepID=UPI00321B813D
MKKSKKLIAALLASLMVLSTAACSDGETQSSSSQQSGTNSSAAGETSSVETSDTGEEGTYDTHVDLSWYKEGITGHEINYDGDAFGQFWQDKFNVTIDLTAATMDGSDWTERLRIWINSGDMPDVAHWAFNYGELADYAAQDAVYRFPDDWKERWPNVAKTQSYVPGAAVAEEKLGGTYVLFRTIFANHRPSERLSYHALLYMRKDWMEACGVEIKETYSPSELVEIAEKFRDQDPGGLGSQLVPISIITYDMLKLYFPPPMDGYYKDENGQFQFAPADERTLESLKKYQNLYTSGLLDPEFYTLTRYEGTEKFYIGGTAGIVLDDGMGYMIQSRIGDGLQKNLGLDPDEVLHIAQLVGEDGKYHYREDMNFYGSIIFSPNLTDEEFERAMDILDFCSTEEGQEIINMGFEGEDWELDENGEYVSLLPNEITGNASSILGSKYPSADVFFGGIICADDFQFVTPNYTKETRDIISHFYELRDELSDETTLLPREYDYEFYSSRAKTQAGMDLSEEYAQLILKDGDLETNWKNWVDEKMQLVQPFLDELNQQ